MNFIWFYPDKNREPVRSHHKGHIAIKIRRQFTSNDAGKAFSALILFELCLVLIYVLDVMVGMPRLIHVLFDLDGEHTIPAWFSSFQLLVIGIVYLCSGKWPQRHRIAAPGFLWLAGAIFVFLSIDEAFELHEKITALLKHIQWVPRFKGNRGIWIPVYLSITCFLAVLFRRMITSICKEFPRQALILFLGLMIFFIGAVGMEIIGYQYLRGMGKPVLYKMEIALEEFLEMAGASIILYGTALLALQDHETASS